MRWGLVPSWSKDPKAGPPLINARAATIATKPSFRTAFKRRRCLIPADGFYEWQKIDAKTKVFVWWTIGRVPCWLPMVFGILYSWCARTRTVAMTKRDAREIEA